MKPKSQDGLDLHTLAVHAGESGDPATGALETPIHVSNVFVPGDAEQTGAVIAGEKEGYLYTRWDNPTLRALETRVAALEGGGCRSGSSIRDGGHHHRDPRRPGGER